MNINRHQLGLKEVLRRALAGAVAVGSVFLFQCQEKGSLNPVGPEVRSIIIELSVQPNQVSAGGGEAAVIGRVVDQVDSPFVNTAVHLRAAQGTVAPTDTVTDAAGRFTAVYRSGPTPGTDTVLADALGRQARELITVVGVSAELTLTPNRTSALANGMDSVRFTATLIGNQGPIARVPVRFETTAGTFYGQSVAYANTDAQGTAAVILTAPSSTRQVVTTVTATVEEQSSRATAGQRVRTVTPRTVKAGLGTARVDSWDAEAQTTVVFRGVSVEVTATPTLLPGDGQSTARIRAVVKEENRQAVASAPVSFSAVWGSIPYRAFTNDAGVAEVSLTAARTMGGQDMVIAGYGPELADTVVITYAQAVSRLEVAALPSTVRANGVDRSQISARVLGETGQPTSGVAVRFFAEQGELTAATAITDGDGYAYTMLTPAPAVEDYVERVWAEVDRPSAVPAGVPPDAVPSRAAAGLSRRELRVGGEEAKTRRGGSPLRVLAGAPSAGFRDERAETLVDTAAVTVRGLTLALSAYPDSVVARPGASAQVTARVYETSTGNPVVRDTVRFSTTLGSIAGVGVLDADGRAEVSLRADGRQGSARVTARYGRSHRDSVLVQMVPPVAAIELFSDKPAVRAGGTDTARVTVRVLDALGNPSPGVPLRWTADFLPGDHEVQTGADGAAIIRLVSPAVEVDTTMRLTVRGAEVSAQLPLRVNSVVRVLTVDSDSVSAGRRQPVQARLRAFERTSRRPVAGDTVWFSAVRGSVTPFAILDRSGSAVAEFLPGDETGAAWVFAQLGGLAWDSVRVELVEPAARLDLTAARPTILADGLDTTLIVAAVSNILGHPTESVWVHFEAAEGEVHPEDVVTGADGRATAVFMSSAQRQDVPAPIRAWAVTVVGAASMQPHAGAETVSTAEFAPMGASGSHKNEMRSVVRPTGTRRNSVREMPGRGLRGVSASPSGSLPEVAPVGGRPLVLRPADADEVADTLNIVLRGVSLGLSVAPEQIRADGRSRAGVNVHLRETTSGTAIGGAEIRFGATLGSITASGRTGPDGRLTDSLTAGYQVGRAIVTASYGRTLTAADTVVLGYNPAALRLAVTLEQDEAAADSATRLEVRGMVTDESRAPAAGVAVVFTAEGALTVMTDPTEYRQVTRWEGSFRVPDPREVEAVEVKLQIRGVDNPDTRLRLNREPLNIDLPRDPLWREVTLTFPAGGLQAGFNRLDIQGAELRGESDRFSVAGVRVGLVGSHLLGVDTTAADGSAGAFILADPTARRVECRMTLAADPLYFARSVLTLVSGQPVRALVATAADTLLRNGEESTDVLALVTDRFGNPVRDGYEVTFAVDSVGTVEPESRSTLGDGTASATLLAPSGSRNEMTRVTVECEGAEAYWEVLMRGVEVSLGAERVRLLADGRSTTTVRARLATGDGAPVAGRYVNFTATRGSVTRTAQTDEQGYAAATLTAPVEPGVGRVIATFGRFIADTLEVQFLPRFGGVELRAEPESLPADGVSATTLTATVTDGLGDPVAGVQLELSTNRGRLARTRLTTDQSGEARTQLTGAALAEDAEAVVVAELAGEGLADTLAVGLRGLTLSVSASADSLSANGTSQAGVTARVQETTSGNPITEGRVQFSATLGTVGSGADLDEDGFATVAYTAGLSEGTAVVRARYGRTLTDSTRVVLVNPQSSLELEIGDSSLLADGVSATEVVARVTDRWGEPAPNVVVHFSFDGPGTLAPAVGRTDDQGEVRARVTAPASGTDGQMVVSAEVGEGELSARGTIRFRGVTVALWAEPRLIAGDGRSTSNLTARVRETRSGRAVTNGSVEFTTSAGSVAASAALDETGQAAVTLRSDDHPAVAVVVASFGRTLSDTVQVAFAGRFSYLSAVAGRGRIFADGVDTTVVAAVVTDTLGRPVEDIWVRWRAVDGVGALAPDSSRTDAEGRAAAVFTGTASREDLTARLVASSGSLQDTVDVVLQGLTVRVAAWPDSLPANGVAAATVTAQVVTTVGGNPVAGRPVGFTTTRGAIPAAAMLDQRGIASVQLTAGDEVGTARVTAAFGATLSAFTEVVLVEPVGSVTLTAAPETILGDGVDSTVITAQVRDAMGNPAAGRRVVFSAPHGGRLSATSGRTGDDGTVSVSLQGFATRADTTLRVEAQAEGGAGQVVMVPMSGIATELTVQPHQLRANGRSTARLTYRAVEQTSHRPVVGKRVVFSSDRGRITSGAVLDTTGTAAATFTAPADSGTATVVAVLGNSLVDTVVIECLPSTPHRARLAVSPRGLAVAGAGGRETAQLTAEVTDVEGGAVPDGLSILFTMSRDLGVRFAGDEDSAQARTEDGVAAVTVRSGEQAGIVTFRAWHEGTFLGEGGALTVAAGAPARLSVRPDPNFVHHPGQGLSALPISALVTDRFANPVADSTPVVFSIIPDSLASVTAVGYTRNGVVGTPVEPVDYDAGVWLTYADRVAGQVVWVTGRAGEDAGDTARVVLPGAVQGGEPDTVVATVDRAVLGADGSSEAQITARVYDAEGDPVGDGTEVAFSAVLGTVTRLRYTASGQVVNTYRAGRVAGVDTVRISSGEASDALVIRLLPGSPATVEVAAEDSVIRGGGVGATTVRAVLRDAFGNRVGAGVPVRFSASLGEIDAQAETDNSGTAEARLTAGNRIGRALVTAASGQVSGQTSVRFTSGSADNVVLQQISREAIGVRGSGSPETSTLTFEVRDARGIPVDTSNRAWVRFRLDGPARLVAVGDSSAYLEPDSALTDEAGRVAVNLNSGYFAGTVQVTASVGEGISGQAISVAVHGGPPDQSHLSAIPEWCNLTGRLGTPVDTVVISAAVGDRYSNPVPPGTTVYFSASGGVIQGSGVTDAYGWTRAALRTTNPWPVAGLDTVIVQTVDWNDRDIRDTTVVLVSGPTTVTCTPGSGYQIPFGAYQDFTVTVSDRDGVPLSRGTTVEISLSAFDRDNQAVDGARLVGDATEAPITITDCDARTDFHIRVFNYIRGVEGATLLLNVSVRSRNGDVDVQFGGTALGQVISPSRSLVQVSPNRVIADGQDEATITVTLYDTLGVAIPKVPAAGVDVTVTAGNPQVAPPDAASDDEGRLTATAVGSEVATAQVVVTALGVTLNQQPVLDFIPGPPSQVAIRVLDRTLEVGGDTTTVVVTVTDASGNYVADGTAVSFTTSRGFFTPDAVTTSGGTAAAVFSSGTQAGQASFTVAASSRGGRVSEEYEDLTLLPGPPSVITVTAAGYNIIAGTQREVTISVRDAYGNIVAAGTPLDVRVTPSGHGNVAPTRVSTDEAGSASATYTAGFTAGDTAHVTASDTSGAVSGVSPVFVFTAGAPGRISLTATSDTVLVGAADTLVAAVADAYGNVVSDTTLVTFSRQPAVGVLSPGLSSTTSGVARTRLSGVTGAGNVTVTAAAGQVQATAMITFVADTASQIVVEASPAIVNPQDLSTITATALDRYGNPVRGVTLNFSITVNPGGSCTINPAQRATGADGTASAVFRAGNTSGWAEVTVSRNGVPAVAGTADITIR